MSSPTSSGPKAAAADVLEGLRVEDRAIECRVQHRSLNWLAVLATPMVGISFSSMTERALGFRQSWAVT